MLSDFLRLFVIGLIVLVIEVGTGQLLDINSIRPDLMLIYVLSISATRGKNFGVIIGFLAGFAQDMITLGYPGLYAFTKSSIGFWFGMWIMSRGGSIRSWMWIPVYLLSGIFQYSITGLFIIQGTDQNFTYYFTHRVLTATLYTGFLGYVWALAPVSAHGRKQFKPVRIRSK